MLYFGGNIPPWVRLSNQGFLFQLKLRLVVHLVVYSIVFAVTLGTKMHLFIFSGLYEL